MGKAELDRPVIQTPLRRTASSGALALLVAAAVTALAAPASAGAQALPFHTSTSLTPGNNESAARNFVSFVARSGLVRDGERVPDPMSRAVDALAIVNGTVFGVTPDWTSALIVPWMRKSMEFTSPEDERLQYDASGVGDAVLRTTWTFLREDRVMETTRLALQARVAMPVATTDARLPNGEVAPRRLQVGDGSWDFTPLLGFKKVDHRWGFHANIGYRFNGTHEGYAAGNVFEYNAAVGFRALPVAYESLSDQTVNVYLELNGEVSRKDRIEDEANADSGGQVLFLSPELQWIPVRWLVFEGVIQLPAFQDLNGTQLEHETRFQLGTRFRFSVFR